MIINEKYLKEFIDKEIKKYLNEKGEIREDLNGKLPKQDCFNETYLISRFTENFDTSNKEIKIKALEVNFNRIENQLFSNESLSRLLTLNQLTGILLKKIFKKEFAYTTASKIFKLIDCEVEDKSLEKLNNTKFKKILIKLFKKFKKEIEILLKIKKLEEIDYHRLRFKIIKIKIFF